MEIRYTHKKIKPFNFFLLLCNTRSRETILKVSARCLSEEMFTHQIVGLDASEIVKLLKMQRDS